MPTNIVSQSETRPGPDALRVEGVSGGYGRRKLFTGVDFSLKPGESVALLGENGAGKSTLLRMLAGRQRPSAGRVLIEGRSVTSLSARRRMAYAPQFLDYPPGLKVDELYRFVSGLYGIKPGKGRPCREWGLAFGIDELLAKPADRLSGGEAKRLALSLAFDSEAPLLLLDEPAASLDRHYLTVLTEALQALKGKRSMLFVSHALPANLAGQHRLLHLDQGRLGSGAMISMAGATLWRLRFRADACPPLANALEQHNRHGHWELLGHDGDDLVRQLVSLGVAFSKLEVTCLEDQHG